ncbi:MAG: 1-(5-phosphoribosyl)-5-((5-phosphoribosylamino)methylideneamino)imidazole-4-carboxamide isomerase, partial [Spirochaetaceae bacterium]
MLIVPAIDLMNGKCVRLLRGDYDTATQYSDDPVAVAVGFEKAGARLIHIVDLDRARGDKTANREVIIRIKRKIKAKIEVGGGVRSDEDVRELLDCGVDRIIIGTALVKEPAKVAGWIAKIGFYAVAGLDAADRKIRVHGWMDDSGTADTDCAMNCAIMGFSEIIYTNIAQDGTLGGPDIESTLEIVKASGL